MRTSRGAFSSHWVLDLFVGLLNATLVVRLRVPAIIATMATGYVLATATLLSNRSIHGFAVSPALKVVAAGRIFGAPIMLLLCLGVIMLVEFVLRRTVYGRTLSAVGQNRVAARLAGVPVDRVVAAAFVVSAVLASLMGLVLGAYVGGAFLEMGQPYLLQSIAAVVVGGTLIFGGSASAIGVFFASVLLILMVTLMQIMQLPPGRRTWCRASSSSWCWRWPGATQSEPRSREASARHSKPGS